MKRCEISKYFLVELWLDKKELLSFYQKVKMVPVRTTVISCSRLPFKMTEQIDLLQFGQCGNCYHILLGKWSSTSSLCIVWREESWCTAESSSAGATGTLSKFSLKDLTGGLPHFIFFEPSLCLKLLPTTWKWLGMCNLLAVWEACLLLFKRRIRTAVKESKPLIFFLIFKKIEYFFLKF